MALYDQLLKIKDGNTKKIRGIVVWRASEGFMIDDEYYSLDDTIAYIEEAGTGAVSKGINYFKIALLIVEPQSNRVVSSYRVKDKTQHRKVLQKAKKKKCYLCLAEIKEIDGKQYPGPMVVDWDSVDAIQGPPEEKKQKQNKSGLYCPYCSHTINSTPGRTLHVKSKHPEKMEEYAKWLTQHGKN